MLRSIALGMLIAIASAGCAVEDVPVDVPVADSELTGAFRSDAARSGSAAGQVGDSPAVAYRIPGTDPVIASPVLAADSVFVPNGSGELIAFDSASGEVRWRSEIGEADSSVVVSSDSVFSLSSDGVVRRHALDTGSVRWEMDLGGSSRSSPLLFEGELWLAVGEELVGLDPSSGARIASVDLGGRADSSPAAADGVIVIGTRSNSLVFVDRAALDVEVVALPRAGSPLTTYADGVAATPAIDGDSVVVGSTEGALVSASLAGSVEWTVDLGAPIYGAVALGDGVGYVPTGSGELIAFSLDDGDVRWRAELGDAAYSSPVLVGQSVLVTAENGQLFSLDAETGVEQWALEVGEVGNFMASTPAVAGSTVVLGSNDGSIVGISTNR